METQSNGSAIDFGSRLRRSRGRTGRTCVASAKVTRAEQEELEAAATAEGKALSEWSREVLLRQARTSRTDPLFTEIVAMRMMLNTLLRPLSCGEIITPDDFTAHMTKIRTTKQKVASDILQQYAAATGKEQ
jgi:hypothetical protein